MRRIEEGKHTQTHITENDLFYLCDPMPHCASYKDATYISRRFLLFFINLYA